MAFQTEVDFALPKGYLDGEGVLHREHRVDALELCVQLFTMEKWCPTPGALRNPGRVTLKRHQPDRVSSVREDVLQERSVERARRRLCPLNQRRLPNRFRWNSDTASGPMRLSGERLGQVVVHLARFAD